MSKRKKIPIIDGLIDIAGGIAMSGIAKHMEDKYHYSKKGKINPYMASAIGIASGKLKTTNDVLRLGGFLGAMGSFDVDPVKRRSQRYVPDDPLLDEIEFSSANDNRYAWRLNCADGDLFGIDPEDYETRDEYNEALRIAKEEAGYYEDTEDDDFLDASDGDDLDIDNSDFYTAPSQNCVSKQAQACYPDIYENDDFHVYLYCLVEVASEDHPIYCRTENNSISKGMSVQVPNGEGELCEGVVISVERHMRFSAPRPITETPVIE